MLNIITKYRQESVDGIHLSVLKSALQKYIRRGESDKALWIASRLDSFADVEGGERIRTNFIHRLMIIYLEDIGFSGLEYWKFMDYLLFDILLTERKSKTRKRTKEIWAIQNAIRIMCMLPKVRACSHLNSVMTTNTEILLETPYKDLAIKNKLDNTNINTKLEYAKYVYSLTDKYSELQKHFNQNIINISKKWFKEIKTKEQFITWNILLTSLVYSDKKLTLLNFNAGELDNTMDWNKQLGENITLDDYVYDKHTIHAKDRTTEYFAEITSIVIPESPLVDKWSKYIYQKLRGCTPIKPSLDNLLESEYASFISRVQLTTSNGKTDVYLAERDGITYIIKGPFLDDTILKKYLEYQVEKATYGMPTLDNTIVYMIPDRWPEGLPLGIRNKVDRTKAYPFLVVRSLIPKENYHFRTHSSKLWPETQVLEPYLCEIHFNNLDILTDNQKLDFLNAIGFRLKYKLSDLGLRNFLIYNDRLYSIDEESVNPDFNLLFELKKNNYKKVKTWYTMYKDKINKKLVKYLDTEFNAL
jgi:hypothetical protein